MGRPRLTPEEREARRRARNAFSFSDAAYKHYNPAIEGYGSPEEWIKAAEALAKGRGRFKRVAGVRSAERVNPDLDVLGLLTMPEHIDGLKKAFRNTMMVVHPDHGGTNEATREALDAYKRLCELY